MSLFRFSIAAAGALCLCAATLAAQDDSEDGSQNLGQINVTGNVESDPLTKKVGETKKSAKQLAKEQVSDSRDMVRHEIGVSVVESGRFGASGYSIRGVDENRVDISIDGLRQAETLSSQGFKDLFEGYGNFNNTRNGVEVENVRQVDITKGADSVKRGSGALGGSVAFETKDARDYLTEKDWYYGFKRGYQSADRQNWQSHAAAVRFKWFDLLAIHTDREGHELKNWGYKKYDPTVIRKVREKPDPYRIYKKSTLVKFGFQPTDTDRFSLGYDKSNIKSEGIDWSNQFALYNTQTPWGALTNDIRHTNDRSERKNYSFTYENFDETPLWDSLKFSYNKQHIKLKSRTDEYCEGDNCAGISNPSGLHINKDGKMVDKYGGEVKTWLKWGFMPTLVDSQFDFSDPDNPKNEPHILNTDAYSSYKPNDDVYVNCDEYDCSKGMTLFDTNSGTYKTYSINKVTTPHSKGNYGKLSPVGSDEVLLPNQNGYVENNWKDRDLNTDTKQFNLDLTKDFHIKSTEHSLSYGGLYSKSDKSMVNRAGYSPQNKQWWAKYFAGVRNTNPKFPILGTWYPDKCQSYTNASAYNNACGHEDNPFSFLIPVETKTGALYVGDDFRINDVLAFDLNYRYDKVKHNPSYTPGVTPKIPTDLFIGMFVPYTPLPGTPSQKEIKAHKDANAEANAVYLASQKRKYSANSYSLATSIDPLDFFRLQLKYANGFRAPTSDEIYFTFQHPDFSIYPNLDLKKETAKTKEIAFTLHNSPSFVTLNLFQTDYRNFIDLQYKGEFQLPYGNGGSTMPASVYQNVNRPKARVRGIEIDSRLALDQIWQPLQGFSIGYKLSIQKGRMDIGNGKIDTPMNAIQPRTAVYSVSYQSPGDKFGADLFVTAVAAKKGDDTYNMYWYEQARSGKIVNGKPVSNSEVEWRSGGYTTIDFVTYVKPIKYLTLRAGAYNITDRKYITWESARSIRPFGTSNLIDQETGLGINRFYSPGRNYKLTWEFQF